MSKYKLINQKTKEEHLCDKVTIDGFDYYMSDNNCIGRKYGISKLNELIEIGVHYDATLYREIVATNNPNIDIPKVVDNIEQMSYDFGKRNDTKRNNPYADGFVAGCSFGFTNGYKKSQETHPFTEEDMIEFAEWLSKIRYGQLEYFDDGNLKPFVELLQMWKGQRTITIYYE